MIDEIKETGRADNVRCEAKNREFYRFYMFVQKILDRKITINDKMLKMWSSFPIQSKAIIHNRIESPTIAKNWPLNLVNEYRYIIVINIQSYWNSENDISVPNYTTTWK